MTNQTNQAKPDQMPQSDENKSDQQSRVPGTETKQPEVKAPAQK